MQLTHLGLVVSATWFLGLSALVADAGEQLNVHREKAETAYVPLKYPGPSPGAAAIAISGTAINVSNQALSMSWDLRVQGLRADWVRDEQLQRAIPLVGEVFQIVLASGQRYAASTLEREGEPRVRELQPDPQAARLAARIPGREVEVPLRSADGRLQVIWRAAAHDDANYVRQEVQLVSTQGDLDLREILWLDQPLAGARMTGRVDGSPVVAGQFFFGCEDPLAINETKDSQGKAGPTDAGGTVSCRLPRNAVLREGQSLTVSFVMGVAPEGQLRRGFLYYLERERAHPYRPFLHYNSWYDTAWQPFA